MRIELSSRHAAGPVAYVLIALRTPNMETGKHLERITKIAEMQQAVRAGVRGEQFSLTHLWQAIADLASEITSPQEKLQGTSKISRGERSPRGCSPSVSPRWRRGDGFLSPGVIKRTHSSETLGENVHLNAEDK
jgi:hypothetical protein